ncbi:hypothetical protein FSPOR_1221 [Fusarium sporotrichioides]|uniref:Uncharacterized protein n=1 Tax=Fusarium sporotrichioides TaxID=5514 RepID=A0A395SQB0_FUSSP|nr:hypothetical protein FSPOR_1221 [Fusarium sporotrichioides]
MPDNRTILGPLTDSWEYPSHCNRLYLAECSSCTVAAQAQKCNTAFPTTIDGREDPLCWPPATAPNVFEPPLSGWGIFKPATKCPGGYTVACTAEGTTQSDFDFQFEVNDDEFVRGCCPPNYACAKYGDAQTCRSIFSTGEPQVISCESGTTVLKELTGIEGITMHAPMFQLAGLKRFETTPATDTESAALTSISTQTSQSNMDSNSGGRLSTGAQAGIGVGVGVVGLGIIGAAFFLWRRRGRPKASPKPEVETTQLDSREVRSPGELRGTPLTPPPPPPQYTPVELDGTPTRQELP